MTNNQNLKLLTLWRTIGWLIVISAIYVSLERNPPDLSAIRFGDKIAHTLSYLGMMLWLTQCYRRSQHIFLAVFLISMGVGLEFLQGMSGYRSFEYADMMANSLGVFLGWSLSLTGAGRILTLAEKIIPGKTSNEH